MKELKRWPIWTALSVFLTGAVIAVTRGIMAEAYIGRSRPWALGNSISYYVGTSTWTAVLFAVLNLGAVGLMGYYLWQLGEVWKMPRVYRYLALILLVSFVWLSVCPVYYADFAGHVSLVSRMHEVSSRTMFAVMALMILLITVKKEASVPTRVLGVLYLALAVMCIFGYLTGGEWFTGAMLIWETSYVLTFMLLMAVVRQRGALQ